MFFAPLSVGVFLAIYLFPKLRGLLDMIKENPTTSFQPRDMAHLTIMFVVFFGLSWLASFIGSFLLGAFTAGMCFVNVARSKHVWDQQVKRVAHWTMIIFFASSVAVSVPLNKVRGGAGEREAGKKSRTGLDGCDETCNACTMYCCCNRTAVLSLCVVVRGTRTPAKSLQCTFANLDNVLSLVHARHTHPHD